MSLRIGFTTEVVVQHRHAVMPINHKETLLLDTDEREAVAEDVAERVAEKLAPTESSEKLQELKLKNAISAHEKECWEHGPIAQLRNEVSALKVWQKVGAIALLLMPLWLGLGGYALSGFIEKTLRESRAHSTGGLLLPSALADERKK